MKSEIEKLEVVYLLIPTSNHNFEIIHLCLTAVVYLLIPTSNHNIRFALCLLQTVVYLLIPTSNHNGGTPVQIEQLLYIFWFLHQTTTIRQSEQKVVTLYIFWFLHQTTTKIRELLAKLGLYIFWFLHQTTTESLSELFSECCISFDSYIKPQPVTCRRFLSWRCISFDSYIKPQLCVMIYVSLWVVYLLIPTSNHNRQDCIVLRCSVVYLLIPTSNHNCWRFTWINWRLYIFWFLHQTTTLVLWHRCVSGCISFDSYIKPQLMEYSISLPFVVYLLIPTSNHNWQQSLSESHRLYIFWFLHQTTTGGVLVYGIDKLYIFWFLHQTTTTCQHVGKIQKLYIFWFLHQTTTRKTNCENYYSCISFDSYIKPQRWWFSSYDWWVVYLLIPTSNHNWFFIITWSFIVVYLLIPTSNHNNAPPHIGISTLYIFWFLHQTTTQIVWELLANKLYIFWFLHQTTTRKRRVLNIRRCISFDSYIKPQPIDLKVLISSV